MAEVKKVLTEEQRLERNKASLASKAKAKELVAKSILLKDFLAKQSDKSMEVIFKEIYPKAYNLKVAKVGGVAKEALCDTFTKAIQTKKQISEDEVFKTFKIGRKEAAMLIKTALKKAAVENRIWISFDDKSGVYSFLAMGKVAPANYKGFVPAEEKQVTPAK